MYFSLWKKRGIGEHRLQVVHGDLLIAIHIRHSIQYRFCIIRSLNIDHPQIVTRMHRNTQTFAAPIRRLWRLNPL